MHITTPFFYNLSSDYGAGYGLSSSIASVITLLIVYLVAIPYHKYVDKFSVVVANYIKSKIII